MRPGRLNKWVTLSRSPQTTPDSDGFFEDLDPAGVWASIQPLQPQGDGRSIFHYVTMRFHPQVTVDTRILHGTRADGSPRELFVRGVQNVDERNVEMRLYCEEVVP